MTDKPIDPGPGWRLLEPGEVVQDGDQLVAKGVDEPVRWISCTSSATCGVVVSPYNNCWYRRRIEPAASQWIPVAEKPLPEAIYDTLVCLENGIRATLCDLGDRDREQVVAWMPLPEPFVPPPTEKPMRREEWIVHCDQYRRQAHSRHSNEHDAKQMANAVNGQYHLKREVLAGDVDPDAARKARERCEKVIHGLRENMYSQALAREILAILNGDDA